MLFVLFIRGMEEGLFLVMDFLEDSGIKGMFLFIGRMVEKFFEFVRRVVKKYEFGCYGFEYERFDRFFGEEVRCWFFEVREIFFWFGKVVFFRVFNF